MSQNSALKTQINLIATNPALALGPFVKVDLSLENGVNGPNVVFTGVNIHIVSGSGSTDDHINGGANPSTGLGNLIIGYNEQDYPGWVLPGERSACHMLIMGSANKYTHRCFGGIVSGGGNYLDGAESFIIGGNNNNIAEPLSIILTGQANSLSGVNGANVLVGGGGNSVVNGQYTVLLGGDGNRGSPAIYSVALGGQNGTVIGVNGIQ